MRELVVLTERDTRLLGVAAEQQQDVAYGLDRLALGLRADPIDERGARFSVSRVDADLDEFMICQRLVDFGNDILGQAGVAEDDNGLQRMAEATQMAFLLIGEFHGPGLKTGAQYTLKVRRAELDVSAA